MKISREKLEQFIKSHAADVKVLDVGASSKSYRNFFPNKISVDLDPDSQPDIVADAHHLPFKDAEFDMVLCTEVLEHVHEPQTVIGEIRRVLKPGGKVVLTTRFMYPLHEVPHDHWRFTVYNLKRLFNDFKEVDVKPDTDAITTFASLFQRLTFQSKFKGNYFWQVCFRVLVWILLRLTWIIDKQFGDIKKTKEVDTAFTTGYHVTAIK